ncbi:MAG: glycine cleavage T C-terminal barrel domain-containing protein [Bryobacter sp.]
MQGYEALREKAAWRQLDGRGRILVHGEDNARLLHAMSTQDIQSLQDGEGLYCFFLTAQGRIQADAYVFRTGADFLLDTESSTAQWLFEHLDKYIIADDVTLEDLRDSHTTLAVEGPAALECGWPVPEQELGIVPYAGGYVVRASETGMPGLRWIYPRAAELSLKLPEADLVAWETVRLEQGKPRYGVEILDKHLVQETRQLHAVHFSKGCYLGQEIVERVRARGQVHKGLASIAIAASEAPEVGAEIHSGETKVGNLLSACYAPALGHVVGFAMLSTDALGGTQELRSGAYSVRLFK